MSCIPSSHSMVSGLSPAMEDSTGRRRGSRAYQIFPETSGTESESNSYSEDVMCRRERLPSIVVEPTEQSDEESGEQGWLPRCRRGEEEEEDSCNEQREDLMGGEPQEEMEAEEGAIVRKNSTGPAQNHPQLSRLTPPPSPTSPETAPPCLRS